MAHPVYRNKNGDKLQSVTTVLSRFKESGGLIHWAWQLGMEGKDYRKVRDEAADAGTIAHLMVEADIRGKEFPDKAKYDKELWDKAFNAYGAYLEWKNQTQLRSENSEVSLVCECHQTGGTLDTILVQNKRSMGSIIWVVENRILSS